MTCAQCGEPCELDTVEGKPVRAPKACDSYLWDGGTYEPRALYFSRELGVDYCSAGCSLAHYEATR